MSERDDDTVAGQIAGNTHEETLGKTKPTGKGDDAQPYTDTEMLQTVRIEMERSVGFEYDEELHSQRIMALDFFKGDMAGHIQSLPNRSKAVSTDVSNSVETVLPDIMEIFTAGGDVLAFKPVKPGDEDAARQETDYLHHVVFQDNPGFLNLYTGFKDGLLQKTCLFEYQWKKDYFDEELSGKTLQDLLQAHASGHVFDVKPDPLSTLEGSDQVDPTAVQLFSFTVRQDRSKAEYWPHPPEDFSVAPDTVRIPDATYACARYHLRVQDLIADGYDPEVVTKLEPYVAEDQREQSARDTAGEHENSPAGDFTNEMLREVEVRKHYIRLKDDETDTFNLWCVVTNMDGSVGIPRKVDDNEGFKLCNRVPRIPFAAGSPYLVPHRFYGLSLADQLIETMKIKTVLTRALLDSSYFALNQRFEVSMNDANDYTIADLLRNEPMVPVRSKNGQAVRPLNSGGLSFDAYAALEYFSVQGEQQSGVVRNAQGLNPDTLHDTAKGALTLMQAAQRRVRMIARVLAETCLKDLFLGLHAVIRENASQGSITKVNGQWVQVDPTQWGERTSMAIEVGLGASGREQDLASMQALGMDMQNVVTLQGGLNGPLVTAENAYNFMIDKAKLLGRKQPERYWTDPKTVPPQPAKPDPKLIAAQMQTNQKAQDSQQRNALAAQKQQTDASLKMREQDTEASLKRYEIDQANQTDIVTASISERARHMHGGDVRSVGHNT